MTEGQATKKPRIYDRDLVGWLRKATDAEVAEVKDTFSAAGLTAYVALADREQADRRAKT
jgi:hypothetical protein